MATNGTNGTNGHHDHNGHNGAANRKAGGYVDDNDVNSWKNRVDNVLSRPGDHVKSRSPEGAQSWFASMFGCCTPIDTCLITWCLPCVTFGKTHHRLHKSPSLQGYEPINTSCLLLCGSLYCCLGWLPIAMERQSIREKYNLQGSCLGDLAWSCCCGCCALVQADKEVEHREALMAGDRAHQAQPYQANNEAMVYPPSGETGPSAAAMPPAPAPAHAPGLNPAQGPVTEK